MPLETRKILLGHKNGDITTHYSAPELEELIEAANRVCEGKSGITPALVVLKHRTLTAASRYALDTKRGKWWAVLDSKRMAAPRDQLVKSHHGQCMLLI